MAKFEITMPQLGESVTEGVISSWLVKVGDQIEQYDPVAEVMSDKVTTEIPASEGGLVTALLVNEGDSIPVGTPILSLSTEAGEQESETTETVENKPADTVTKTSPQKPAAETSKVEKAVSGVRYSPAVLALSQENNVDLSQVTGTGANGRITRKDVQKFIDNPSRQPVVTPVVEHSRPAPKVEATQNVSQETMQPELTTDSRQIVTPATGIRKMIAKNMLQSVHEVPQAWTMLEVDVTDLVKLRNQYKVDFKNKNGFSLSFFPFFVKAVAQSLQHHPKLNSSWQDGQIVQYQDINLSIAVATDDALFVPVIKNADRLSIAGIAHEINRLATDVRKGSLAAKDMQGGTFTVNNTGSFGSIASMGIINYPQAAILQVEAITKVVAVTKDNQIGIRDKINLCLSLDHRLLDGLAAGKFLQDLKGILENYNDQTQIY